MPRDWRKFWAEQADARHPALTSSSITVSNWRSSAVIRPASVCWSSAPARACCSRRWVCSIRFYRGVDFSKKMLAVFRAAHATMQVVCADASRYVDDEPYDLICSNQMLQNSSPEMFRRYLANARRMLAPGGRLVVGSIPWRGARNAFYLQAANPSSTQGLSRRLALLARAYAGVDLIGYWYSYRECIQVAQRHGLTPTFFGRLHMRYRFRVRMDDTAPP